MNLPSTTPPALTAPLRATLAALVVAVTLGAGAAPAAVAASTCDATALDWSELSAAMFSDAEKVCLGASITGVVGHLTISGAGKTLDLNGFDLSVWGEDRYAAIEVPAGSSLTLEATGGGSLIATGGTEGAGIGGSGDSRISQYGHSGSITISSGTYTFAGGMSSAGIGAGWGGDAGPVVISGGTVFINSGSYGAGVGGGDGGDGGSVTITGGVVTIGAGYLGAGIGGGVFGAGGDVDISGGRLSILAGCRAATIGAGAAGTVSGTLTVAGLVAASATGAGTAQSCSDHPVGVGAETGLTESGPGVFAVMESRDETASEQARTLITYYSDVLASVDGVVTEVDGSPVAYGDLLGGLPNVTSPDGRGLDSWRLNGTDGPEFDLEMPITAPVTLFARWADAPARSLEQPPELAATGAAPVATASVAATSLLTLGVAVLLWRRRVMTSGSR